MMQNNSNAVDNSTSYKHWRELDWILPEAFNIFLMLLTGWILWSLVYYGVKTKKWKTGHHANLAKLSGGKILTNAVLCAITTLLRLITSQFVYNIGYTINGHDLDEVCEKVLDLSIVMYCISVFFVYLYLWKRQNVFYTNSMLQIDFNLMLRIFSWLSIVFVVLGALAATLVNTIPKNYHSSVSGCTYNETSQSNLNAIIGVSVTVLLFGQVILVGLFIYPLIKRKKQSKRHCSTKAKCIELAPSYPRKQPSQSSNKSNRKINKILSRTLIFSITSFVTDICFLIVSTFAFDGSANRRISTVLYDFSAFLNLSFIVCSFLCWRKILTYPMFNRSFTNSATGNSSQEKL